MSRGLGDVYKRQNQHSQDFGNIHTAGIVCIFNEYQKILAKVVTIEGVYRQNPKSGNFYDNAFTRKLRLLQSMYRVEIA